MSDHSLATYLNDHLAGSVVALELLDHLEATNDDAAVTPFLAELREDIAEDRQELESLMGRLGAAVSQPRKAAAWLTAKFADLKLRLDDPAGGPLRLLEALEALAVGIEGKRALWRALAAATEAAPGLRGVDYARLERRADEQRRRVEVVRLEAAKVALASTPPARNR